MLSSATPIGNGEAASIVKQSLTDLQPILIFSSSSSRCHSYLIDKNNLSKIFIWSILINILVVFGGTLLSYWFPKSPTGPWIVVLSSLLALGAIIWKQKNINKNIKESI
ncbi:MAG: metal ABC transporter permease [Leptolyngbyaceae cyanobacterium RM2_2_4]|nr:metal ABC transporter permease [Leptolyngbyaceae cyanobacterium RM2_2_4]